VTDQIPTTNSTALSTAKTHTAAEPLTILIAALGGEGGGVLMNWIVDCALKSGLAVQATSVPGVAQRTGSTSYYIEMQTTPLPPGTPDPVFALVPMPARVDLLASSELVEAGRMLERGFVSPKRTTLITSTSRFYTTAEKIEMGDGRFAPDKIHAAGNALAKHFIALDLDSIAREHGTMVSATVFGAMAASGKFPWDRATSERAIGDGRGAEASRKGFAAAYEAALKVSAAKTKFPQEPSAKIEPQTSLTALIEIGKSRCATYQDAAYGETYAVRIQRLLAVTAARDPVTLYAIEETARRLALWMTYEDIPRVAELKLKPERFAGIRKDAEMAPGQILKVTEHLKPGAEEIAAMLPVKFGEKIMRRLAAGKSIPGIGRGIHLTTTSMSGHFVMRLLAKFKSIRRRSLRFAEEQAAITDWLDVMQKALSQSPAYASALAEMPRLLKGYGETQTRGRAAYRQIRSNLIEPAVQRGLRASDTAELRKAMAAALADPDHRRLTTLLSDRSN
jgi:indolepyruvate ferredoxin oxidoreductase beta subunit